MKIILVNFLLVFIHTFAFSQSTEEFRLCFEPSSSQLSDEHLTEIESIAKLVQQDNFNFLKIFGYATPDGDEDDNLELSEKRALAVYEAIKSRFSFPEAKCYVTWIGEDAETYELHYENAQPQTPCVEILLLFY